MKYENLKLLVSEQEANAIKTRSMLKKISTLIKRKTYLCYMKIRKTSPNVISLISMFKKLLA